MDAVAQGATLTAACKAVGLPYSTVWSWIQIGMGKTHWVGRRCSDKRKRQCIELARMYDQACQERESRRIEAAIEAIRIAGEEGHKRRQILTVVRPLVHQGQIVRDSKGQPVTYTEERHLVEQETPDWRAAVKLIEKLAPDLYGPRSNVVVSGGVSLREGEAEAVVSACTPDELSAIERGDEGVLRKVLERVRMNG